MAITVAAQARVNGAAGDITLGSYTVATDDVVSIAVSLNTNLGQAAVTVTKSAGTATIGTAAQRESAEAPFGGQFDIWDVVVTGGGTLSLLVNADPFADRMNGNAFILTGVDLTALPNVTSSGTSTTNNINVGATTTVANCLVVAGGTEWNDLGNPTSSDLANFTAFNGAGGSMSGCSGTKAIASAGAYTVNLDAAGGSPAGPWNWATVAYAPAGGAAATSRPYHRRPSGLLLR